MLPLAESRPQGSQTKAPAPYAIAIDAARTEAKVNSGQEVRILLTNLTDKDLILDVDNGSRGESDYTIQVLDKDGQEPPRTRYHRAVRGEDSSDPNTNTVLVFMRSSGLRAVKPGKALEEKIDLNELYVLKPGKYSVQVERLDSDGKTHMKSNKITVTVNP